MESQEFQPVQLYLDRIDYEGDTTPNLENLNSLIRHHVSAIPFENVDVLNHKVIDLSLEALSQKVLLNGRGGYCFELNTLFEALLRELGYTVKSFGARVIYGHPPSVTRPRTHKVLMVPLKDKEWLVDVTFGAARFTKTIEWKESESTDKNLKITKQEDDFLLQTYFTGQWLNIYRFDKFPMLPIDYEVANFYTSTHPKSPFRHRLSVNIVEGKKSHILTGCEYTIVENHVAIKSTITYRDQILQLLRDVFKINVTNQDLDFFNSDYIDSNMEKANR